MLRFRISLMTLILFLLLPCSSLSEVLTCEQLPMVMQKFLANHYSVKRVSEQVKIHAADQMIKNLDPSKTLLYQSDVDKLKPLLQGLFQSTTTGDCAALKPVYDLLVDRARENEALAKKILETDFRLDENTELNINVNRRARMKNKAEKYELLRKIVQFQIENALLTEKNFAEAKKQQIHYFELQTKRVIERNPEKLITISAEAFALALDPHTTYLSAENFDDFRIQMQLSLEGIGAILSSDNGFTVIEELTPGGGAEKSGLLKPKDKIIAVAQEGEKPVNVIDRDLFEVIRMIRGRKGTKVTLTILRHRESTVRFDVTIRRDKVELKEQEAKIEYQERTAGGKTFRFGVIDLASFYGNEEENKSCYEDVKKLLREAVHRHVDGIVLDLSRNGGGLLSEAVRLAGLFIDQGGIVATKDSLGKVMVLANGSVSHKMEADGYKVISLSEEAPNILYTGPLAVLTSRMSASASEIVAGALKDYRRAVIVGADHTYGKGSVQVMMPLNGNLGGMTVTTGMYFLPGGKSTQKTGIEANVRLPQWFALEDIGETELDYPLPAQAIVPFLAVPEPGVAPWKSIEPSMLEKLAFRSKARIDTDSKFREIIKNNKEAAGRKGFIRLTDLRREMEHEKSDVKEASLAEVRKKSREQYAPFINESVNVLLDLVTLGSTSPSLSSPK